MSGNRKEIKKLVHRLVRDHRCTVEYGLHIKVRGPSGGMLVVAGTTHDTNAMRILRACAKRELGIAL